MTYDEFRVLEALSSLEDRGWTPTAKDIAEGLVLPPRAAGYILRALETRGHVAHAGRRHGGAWKWSLEKSGFALVTA